MRFELTTPCLQGRCNNHYATPAKLYYIKYIMYSDPSKARPTSVARRRVIYSYIYNINELLHKIK